MTRSHPFFRILEYYGTHGNHRGKWRVHAKLRDAFHVDIDADLEVDRAGLRWILNPSDDIQSGFFWTGAMDPWELYHLKRLLKPGNVVFDLGANFGYYSIMIAKYLNNDCHIYAFEPFPSNYRRLI